MIYTKNKISYDYAKNVKENATTYFPKDIYEIHHEGNMLSKPRNVLQESQGSAECNLSTTGLLVPTYTCYSTGFECAGT
jgi:hypothetical protein